MARTYHGTATVKSDSSDGWLRSKNQTVAGECLAMCSKHQLFHRQGWPHRERAHAHTWSQVPTKSGFTEGPLRERVGSGELSD